MVVYIRVLMNNANDLDLDVGRLDYVEHHMPALWKTPVAWFYIVPLSTEFRVGCQTIESIKKVFNVALCLLDAPLPNRVLPNLLKIVTGKST